MNHWIEVHGNLLRCLETGAEIWIGSSTPSDVSHDTPGTRSTVIFAGESVDDAQAYFDGLKAKLGVR